MDTGVVYSIQDYASFWKRIGIWFIDMIVLVSVGFGVYYVLDFIDKRLFICGCEVR